MSSASISFNVFIFLFTLTLNVSSILSTLKVYHLMIITFSTPFHYIIYFYLFKFGIGIVFIITFPCYIRFVERCVKNLLIIFFPAIDLLQDLYVNLMNIVLFYEKTYSFFFGKYLKNSLAKIYKRFAKMFCSFSVFFFIFFTFLIIVRNCFSSFFWFSFDSYCDSD